MKNLLVVLSFLLPATTSVVWAGEWEDGYAAYERQDYITAVRKWRIVAERGDRSGQSILGSMYAQGQGVPQDYFIAVKWYRLAAAQGEIKAQYKLGFMYANGQGVPRDFVRSYMWSYLAAIAGHPEAARVRDLAEKSLNLDQFSTAKKLALGCQQRKFQDCY